MKFRFILIISALLTPLMASAVGPVGSSQGLGFERPENGRAEVASGEEGPLPVVKAVGNLRDSYDKFIHQIQYDNETLESDAKPEPIFDYQKAFIEAQKYNRCIAIINKAADKTKIAGNLSQHMRVYCKNSEGEWSAKDYPVATGKEEWVCERLTELVKQIDPATGREKVVLQDKGGWKQVWTGTPTGCYQFKGCNIDHKSGEFGGAAMPHACFFNGGRAIHEGDPNEVHKLGNEPASHGCVRLGPDAATYIFSQITATGAVLNPNDPRYRATCSKREGLTPEQCEALPRSMTKNLKFQQEVADINAGKFGNTPSATMPKVPTVSANCNFNSGKMVDGLQAMAMVICRDTQGRDCSKTETNANNMQPKPVPKASEQAVCQERMERATAAYNVSAKRKLPMPQPLSGEYAEMANAYREGRAYVPPEQRQQQTPSILDFFRPRPVNGVRFPGH